MTTLTRSGIPTTYRDTRFRSRLEARWAAFFDLVGWDWTYEPFDAPGYIPDFLVHGERAFLVEIGPCVTEADYASKADKPRQAFAVEREPRVIEMPDGRWGAGVGYVPEHWMLIAGVTPLWPVDGGPIDGAAGVWHMSDEDPAVLPVVDWRACDVCDLIALTAAVSDTPGQLWPCGHWTEGIAGGWVTEDLRRLWTQAGNTVQWNP